MNCARPTQSNAQASFTASGVHLLAGNSLVLSRRSVAHKHRGCPTLVFPSFYFHSNGRFVSLTVDLRIWIGVVVVGF